MSHHLVSTQSHSIATRNIVLRSHPQPYEIPNGLARWSECLRLGISNSSQANPHQAKTILGTGDLRLHHERANAGYDLASQALAVGSLAVLQDFSAYIHLSATQSCQDTAISRFGVQVIYSLSHLPL